MADLSDVQAWFAGQCETICYPTGIGNAPITGTGKKITIGSGWPDPQSLDAAMAAGNAFVTVYPMPGMERNTTRYPLQWQQNSLNTAKLTLTLAQVNNGFTVTVGGTIQATDAPVVTVGNTGYGYAVLGTDTINSVAAALAALIPGASAIGAVITIITKQPVTVVVTVQGIAAMEVRRQQRVFGVYVWAPDQATRDKISQAIDLAMAQTERFTLPDSSSARLIYHGTLESDELQVRKIYKRLLQYQVEYATFITEISQTVGAVNVSTTSSIGT